MTLQPSDVARYTQSIVLDAVTIKARLTAVLDHLEQSTGGYRANASGANVGGGTSTGGTSKPVERAAEALIDGRTDTAAEALANLEHNLIDAANILRNVTRIINGWWVPDSDAGRHSDAAARVFVDNDACPNHRKYGVHEPRAQGRTHCRWCYEVSIARSEAGEPLYGGEMPDRELVEYRRRWGKVTPREYTAFAERVADRQAAAKIGRKRKRKGKGAAA